jgi:hypothetical protein
MANTVTPHEVRVINGRKGGQRTNSYESLATRLINGLKSDELSEQQRKSIAGQLLPYLDEYRTKAAS